MANPSFVLPMGVMQIPPDYAYRQVGQQGFPLKARYDVLKKLVDRCLNDNLPETGISYTPIKTLTPIKAPHSPVYLMVSTYRHMESKLPPFSGQGWMSQQEVIFTIPLLRWKKGKETPDGVALFTPFAYVDNAWSIITGNLLMGFQKGLASFQRPPETSNPYPTEVWTTVFPVFNPETQLSAKRWICIEARREETAERREAKHLWPLGPVEHLYGRSGPYRPAGPFPVNDEVLEVLRAAPTSSLEAVQLLQLRDPDPAASGRAAYSRIVRFAVQLKGVHDGNRLAPAQIDIQPFDSLPVAETLGLVGDQKSSFPPFCPYWVDCDLDFNFVAGPEDLPAPRRGA